MRVRGRTRQLSDYGDCIATYKGTGAVTTPQGVATRCAFRAGQLQDGSILLGLRMGDSSQRTGAQFRGVASDGSELSADIGLMRYQRIKQGRTFVVDAIHETNRLTVTTVTRRQAHETRFGLTNLQLLGTETDGSLPLALPIDDRTVRLVIRPLASYDAIMAQVKSARGIEPTCEAVIDMSENVERGKTEEIINNLCYLLSVARGTKVNWIYLDEYDEEGVLVAREHHARVTKKWCPLALIDTVAGWGGVTRDFVEAAFPVFVSKRQRFQLDSMLIDAYLDGKAEGDYLQMRGVKLAVALEVLKAVYLRQDESMNEGYILPVEEFNKHATAIQKQFRCDLKTMGFDKATREGLINDGSIRGLNRLPFRLVIQSICKEIGFDPGGQVIKHFVAYRNSLIHNGRFYCELPSSERAPRVKALATPAQEYFFLLHFLDRLLLRLLGYSGPYIDWSVPGGPVRREAVL